jgi:hypothetical protein
MPLSYPLDLTGQAPSNLIVSEIHPIAAPESRIFVPDAGPFFTLGLELRTLPGNVLLQPGVDYKALYMYRDAVSASGKEVCAVLYVYNPAITGDVTVKYQCIGGQFSETGVIDAIEQALSTFVAGGGEQVAWGQLIDVPVSFPPSLHMHHTSTVWGFDDLINILEQIRTAILSGDGSIHQMIFQYIATYVANNAATSTDVDDLYTALTNAITGHTSSSSAHTKAQVGLSNVPNWAAATLPQAQGGVHATSLMTPFLTKALVDALVTKTTIGLSNVPNYGIADAVQAVDINNNTTFSSPKRVYEMIVARATKTVVGLGNLENYGIPSAAEAYAGLAADKYATVEKARMTATGLFGSLSTETTLNPDTCAYPIFFVNESQAASLPAGAVGSQEYTIIQIFKPNTAPTVRDATVARTQLLFAKNRAGIWRREYTGATWTAWTNAVDKAFVGLGNLGNYAAPTDAEAFAGALVDRYMNPVQTVKTVQGAMRHVGSYAVNPNNILVPVTYVQHANAPTGSTGATAGNVFLVHTYNVANAAADLNDVAMVRSQVAIGQNVTGIYRRSFASSVWTTWERVDTGGSSELGTVNLNTVLTEGVYRQSNSGNITIANNYPANNTETIALTSTVIAQIGTLIVEKYSIYTRQTYKCRSPAGVELVWVRHFDTGSWSTWRYLDGIDVLYSKSYQTAGAGVVTFNVGQLPALFPRGILWIRLWGGGGSGGVVWTSTTQGAAQGGGGGAYADIAIRLDKLSINQTINVRVGAGATGVTRTSAGATNGGPGESSYISFLHADGALINITAQGGLGGFAAENGSGTVTGGGGGFAVINQLPAASARGNGGAPWTITYGAVISVSGVNTAINGGAAGGEVASWGAGSLVIGNVGMRGRTLNGGDGGTSTLVNDASVTASAGSPKGGGGGAVMSRSNTAARTVTSGAGGRGHVEFLVVDQTPPTDFYYDFSGPY